MLKILVFGFLLCVGIAVMFAFYAAYRITKMGQAMGRRNNMGTDHSRQDGFITTTGTTIHDSENGRFDSPGQFVASNMGNDAGDAIGSTAADAAIDFGGGDSAGSDSSSSNDSGGGDSGGGSSD